MGRKKKLNIRDDLDFAYLLELMRPLSDIPEYSLLPELFCIVGHENLLKLCKYAGGKTITLPTLEELKDAMYALQWFYDVDIKKIKDSSLIPANIQPLVNKIREVYRC